MRKLPPIIAFEGIDGSGKSVQFKALKARLTEEGFSVGTLDFPQYESFFGKEIGKMLSCEEGVSAAEVDVKSMSLWYAMDREQAFRNFSAAEYDVVLLNRSTMANAAYQGTRCRGDINDFTKWIFNLEFNVLKIPQPELFFIFDIPVATSRRNVALKGHRDYVGDDADVYERDLAFLESVRRGYIACSEIFPGACLLECAEADGTMKPIDEISEIVYSKVISVIKGA